MDSEKRKRKIELMSQYIRDSEFKHKTKKVPYYEIRNLTLTPFEKFKRKLNQFWKRKIDEKTTRMTEDEAINEIINEKDEQTRDAIEAAKSRPKIVYVKSTPKIKEKKEKIGKIGKNEKQNFSEQNFEGYENVVGIGRKSKGKIQGKKRKTKKR
jgi:hypothetical protein